VWYYQSNDKLELKGLVMPTDAYDDFKRDGLDKVIKLGQTICRTVTTFAPIIRGKYRNEPTIIALLSAIEAVCAVLPDAKATLDAFPSDDGLPPADASNTLGINPSAPPAPDPDDGVT